jgi:Scavenger mRNA decapping enzyme C-term binding
VSLLYSSHGRQRNDASVSSVRVEDVLSGKAEADKVLYNNLCPSTGYVILPDSKWDLITRSSLYLVAIIRSKDISSLRDLQKKHLDMLRSIRREAARVVEKWGLGPRDLRLFVHYQPSYCELSYPVTLIVCANSRSQIISMSTS